MEHENDNDTIFNWCSWYSHQRISARTGGFGNKRTSGDHPNYNIVEIGQNTGKSPGHLRRFAVAQTPMRNHRLTLVGKPEKNNNNRTSKSEGIEKRKIASTWENQKRLRCLPGVMVKAMDCGIGVSAFELQSRLYVPFRINAIGKGMNPLILPAMGLIVPLLFF